MITRSLSVFLRPLALVAVTATLGACASAPTQYYTLAASDPANVQGTARYGVNLHDVTIPDVVDKPQLMVRSSTDSSAVAPLNGSRWAGSLQDEIQKTLSANLVSRLGAINVQGLAGSEQKLPVWLIQTTFHRFDMILNKAAVIDVTWRINPVRMGARSARVCQTRIQVQAGSGVDALVQSQSQALALLSDVIAGAIDGRTQVRANDGAQIQSLGCHSG